MIRRLARRLIRRSHLQHIGVEASAPSPIVEPAPPPSLHFDTYDAARVACQHDYEEPGLINFLAARNKGATFDLETLPTPAVLATFDALRRAHSGTDEPVRVLDLGGAFGAHLLWAERHLPFRFKWAVSETPALAAAAEPRDNLAFFSRIQDAAKWLGGIDLFLASGVIQYFREPVGILKDITIQHPKIVLISRTIVSLGKPVFEIQRSRLFDNGPGPVPPGFDDREVRMVHTYHPEADILSLMTNHQLVYRLYEGVPRTADEQPVRDGAIYLFELAGEKPRY